jgi:hypothetical protein
MNDLRGWLLAEGAASGLGKGAGIAKMRTARIARPSFAKAWIVGSGDRAQ